MFYHNHLVASRFTQLPHECGIQEGPYIVSRREPQRPKCHHGIATIRKQLHTLNAMAHADGQFHPSESDLLCAVANETKIYGGEREELLKLAAEQGKLFRKITQFFS